MHPRVIGMLFTLKCNAKCKHCCFQCSPRRKEHMELGDALGYLEQIQKINSIKGISITGGEPFFDYASLKYLFEQVGISGLKARIVTNCFWASSKKKSHQLLLPLVENGLKELSVSFDQVHQQFIPKIFVKNAVSEAIKLNLKVVISTTLLSGDIIKHVEEIKNEFEFVNSDNLYIMPGYIAANGRASDFFPFQKFNRDSPYSISGSRFHFACPHVIKEPIITPAGELAACCSPSTSTRTGFLKEFIVGSLRDKSLHTLLSDLENDLIFNILMLEGPIYLYNLLFKHNSISVQHLKYINICDLCVQLLKNDELQDVIQNSKNSIGDELAVKKLYLDAIAGGDLEEYFLRQKGLFQLRSQR